MEKLPDRSLWIDFVSLTDERWIPNGYGFIKDTPIHHDWVTIHPLERPTIEITSRTAPQRDGILESLAAVVGVLRDQFVLRAFDRPGQWKELQAKLKSNICGHDGNRRKAKEPAAYSMHARRGERLDDLRLWSALSVKHEDARELGFFFDLPFTVDGYPEVVFYYIQTATGQIKFPPETSEYARRQVRYEYLQIARRP